jgi:hypothetical protein
VQWSHIDNQIPMGIKAGGNKFEIGLIHIENQPIRLGIGDGETGDFQIDSFRMGEIKIRGMMETERIATNDLIRGTKLNGGRGTYGLRMWP